MARFWIKVLDIGLTLWVLRGPLVAVLVGAGILLLVPQAQDLLVEPASDGLAPALLLNLGVLFAWAMPTHYAARLLVTTDARYVRRMGTEQCRLGKCRFETFDPRKYISSPCCFRSWLVRWSPRLLAVLIFLTLIGAAIQARSNIPDLNEGFGALMIVFLAYAVGRARLARRVPVVAVESFARSVWTIVPHPVRTALSLNPAKAATASSFGPLLLLFLFMALTVGPIVQPYEFAGFFPRAAAGPFVLGGWVPVIALLCGLGRRYRAPLITMPILLLLLLPAVFHRSYRVQPVNANDQAGTVTNVKTNVDTSGLTLNDAVDLWKAKNCDSRGCPRPIIVTGSGGASRAGFFTASVVGQMLDGGLTSAQSENPAPAGVALRNRLFAFSTVSGSSVGAVMATAAMAASPDEKQPCTGKSPLWYGATGQIRTWRDCLEALMAGDFLTPIFTGFVFHDVFRFIGWQDRGVLLERSLEKQYTDLIKSRLPSTPEAPCTGDLRCPFMALRPNQSRWLPILVLNSTSVTDGQRIIMTSLKGNYQSTRSKCPLNPQLGKTSQCPLFESGKMLRDWLTPPEDSPPEYSRPDDFKLSTAAHNSARFPLLSPPGELHNSKGQLVDWIVDGGYFENLGVQTATEIAEAIIAVDSSLKPFILAITNDPTLCYERKEQSRQQNKKDLQRCRTDATEPPTRSFIMDVLTDVVAPLSAVAKTRDARGVLALYDVPAMLDDQDDMHIDVCYYAHVRVWGEPDPEHPGSARDLSWSWWLSRPVQQYLHEQMDDKTTGFEVKNGLPIRDLLRALADRTRPDAPAARCSADGL